MKYIGKIIFAAIVVTMSAAPAHTQQLRQVAPQWVNDTWRSANYPQSAWYAGFSQDGVKPGSTASAEAIKRVEKDARNKMVENITARVTSASRTETSSSMAKQGAHASETVRRDYGQIVQVSASAEVVKTEAYSWYDEANSRIYAFVAVKRSALADYYAAQVDAGLGETQRHLDHAKQFTGLGKRKEAMEKLAEAQKRLASIEVYRDLLIAVDPENGVKRSMGDRASALAREITAAGSATEDAMAVFIACTETILGQNTDIVASGVQALLDRNNVRMTENRSEAGYILSIDAKTCNPKSDGGSHYMGACVKVTLTNAKTGKNEVSTNVSGKGGGSDPHAAGEEAFRFAAPEVWDAVKGKIMANY